MKMDEVKKLIKKNLEDKLDVWGPGSTQYRDYLAAAEKLGYKKLEKEFA